MELSFHLAVINPDVVGTIQSEGIAAPNEFRIQIGEVDILDDDILNVIHQSKAFASKNSIASFTDDRFI